MGATDSKLAFKKGVFRLFEERNISSSTDDYWEQVLGRLFQLCESPEFLTRKAPASQVLNCVRILTRIFPFIFESEDFDDWEESYFWTPSISVESGKSNANMEVLQAETLCETASELRQFPMEEVTLEPGGKPLISRGERLIKSLLDLLFTSGFTLPTALETRTRVSYVIWETGIGSSKPIGSTKELDDNRSDILRLLLVLFSKSIYVSPESITTTENRWIDTVATGSDRQSTLAILCSLINSALKYNPSGWGLPYNHVMFSDQRELLVMLCLQIIVVLLDYQVFEKLTQFDNMDGTQACSYRISEAMECPMPESAPTELAAKNQFRYYLSRLHREQDFLFLTDGIYRILSNPMAASSTYLPGSTKQVKYHQEMLMLCWKTLEINKRFRNYLLETNRVLDVVIILLYFSLEYRQDTSHDGLVRMCAYMLQTLSKDRAFGYCLNKPFDGHSSLPVDVKIRNFHGTYTDYLVCESNHKLLGLLLDTVCSIIYYQAASNAHLIYTLVQYEPKIQIMAQFTLQRGLDDIHRLRYQKVESTDAARSPSDSSQSRPTDGRQHKPVSSRQQSCQGTHGESSQNHAIRSQQSKQQSSTPMDASTTGSTSRSSSDSVSSASPLFTSAARDSSHSEDVATRLVRPESIDLIVVQQGDGEGHEGDVEDEGGPSTVLKDPKERTNHVISEKAQGKQSERSRRSLSSFTAKGGSSFELERGESKRCSDFSRSVTPYQQPTLSAHSPSYQEQTTAAQDVGQNGFVPTHEW
ncbi:hypothetical protein BGZ80_000963, partial [Entomortierella chlamydospora]